MKLELKHWAAYIPYGIPAILSQKGIFNQDDEYPNPKTRMLGVIKNISFWNPEITGQLHVTETYSFDFDDIEEVCICLHPLSDLTKEIEVNGEKFIPIIELAKKEAGYDVYVKDIHSSKDIFWVDFEDSEEDEFRFCYCINSFQKGKLNPNSHTFVQNQIELWNMLLSWHFDIYGLIDTGLAVDINTVKF